YTRWGERHGYTVDILDMSEGEEAGIKGAVLEIKGENAYGFLHPESGVHRLVRISPFDSQARRHTSFASVFVVPVVNTEINIDVRDDDIRMDVFRAAGAGGPWECRGRESRWDRSIRRLKSSRVEKWVAVFCSL